MQNEDTINPNLKRPMSSAFRGVSREQSINNYFVSITALMIGVRTRSKLVRIVADTSLITL